MQPPVVNSNSVSNSVNLSPQPAQGVQDLQSRIDSDEIEIDLRKYVSTVTARWRLVLTSIVIAALLGGLFSQTLPAPYEAVATIAIVKTATQVQFDDKFKTVTQDPASTTTADTRRATFVGLVENAQLASSVIKRLDQQLVGDDRDPAKLLDKVKAVLGGRGDLILIQVRNRDANMAATIATAWAQEYERYVNGLYAGAPAEYSTSVSSEYQRAVTDFGKAQTALEQYIANSQINTLHRSISETAQLLDTLQIGRQNALTLVISEQLKVNSQIIAAYLGAQSANRLVAFEKEQEGRRNLVKAYMDAKNNAEVSVFSEQVQADLELLHALNLTQVRVQQLLGDATAMRDQVRQGGDAAAQSNSLALSLLKTQAFAFTVPISGNVQLSLQSQPAAASTAEGQVADLNALVSSLTEREKAIVEQIKQVSNRLLTGAGYRYDVNSSDTSKVTDAISTTYSQLFDVGPVGKLSEAVPITNPLTLAAQQKAGEILRFRSDSLSVNTLADDGSSDDAIKRLQKRLTDAEAQLENAQSTYDQLRRDRDLKRDTADTLARKQAEVNLASAVSGSEVRMASPALPPERRVVGLGTTIGIAALVGLLLGIGLCFIAQALIGDDPKKVPGQGSFGRLARWVLLPQPA